MLKLCFLSKYFPPFYGGGSSRIDDLTSCLENLGNEIYVITPITQGEREDKSDTRRIFYIRNIFGNFYPFEASINPFLVLAFFVKLISIYHFYRPNFIISTIPSLETGLATYMLSKIIGVNYIIDIRDLWIMNFSKKIREKSIFGNVISYIYIIFWKTICSNASLLTCATLSQKKIISKLLPSTKVEWLPNGANIQKFKPIDEIERIEIRREFGFTSKEIIIIYAGALSRIQGIDTLIKATYILNKLWKKKYKIEIFGGGKNAYLKTLQELIERLGVNEFITIHNWVSREKIAKIIAASDVGAVLLSSEISFPENVQAIPTKFYEFAACGIPIVASTPVNGQLYNEINKNKLGIAVPSENPELFADSILRILKHGREHWSKRNRNIAIDKYSREKYSKKFLDYLSNYYSPRDLL